MDKKEFLELDLLLIIILIMNDCHVSAPYFSMVDAKA